MQNNYLKIFRKIYQAKKNKKNENLFRHISYLIGVIFYSDPQACKDYVNQWLQNFQVMFEKCKKEGKDNVIAALLWLINIIKSILICSINLLKLL